MRLSSLSMTPGLSGDRGSLPEEVGDGEQRVLGRGPEIEEQGACWQLIQGQCCWRARGARCQESWKGGRGRS